MMHVPSPVIVSIRDVPHMKLSELTIRGFLPERPEVSIYVREGDAWRSRVYPLGVLGLLPYLQETFRTGQTPVSLATLSDTIRAEPERRMHMTRYNLLNEGNGYPFFVDALHLYELDRLVTKTLGREKTALASMFISQGPAYADARVVIHHSSHRWKHHKRVPGPRLV